MDAGAGSIQSGVAEHKGAARMERGIILPKNERHRLRRQTATSDAEAQSPLKQRRKIRPTAAQTLLSVTFN
jgi:hypothetical protein